MRLALGTYILVSSSWRMSCFLYVKDYLQQFKMNNNNVLGVVVDGPVQGKFAPILPLHPHCPAPIEKALSYTIMCHFFPPRFIVY